MKAEPFARLEHVSVRYGDRVVLRDVNLDIVRGAITAVIGMSGAGKSTILRLLDGLRRPDGGRVIVDGVAIGDLPEQQLVAVRQRIGFAFQLAALFDSLTIYDNAALPLREHGGLDELEVRRRVNAALESVGLHGVGGRYPAELSGGMLKRAGFARAVIARPECVLYDEPTTGLDPIMSSVLTRLIVELRSKLDGTAVVVSHDLASVFAMADYIAMLWDGAIAAYGTTDEIRNSADPVVQQFLGGKETGPIAM